LRSIQCSIRAIGGRNDGKSTASSNRPSGSIQRPNTGRMLNTPPTIKNPAVGMRHNLACGWRNARDLREIQSGRRASNRYRSESKSSFGGIVTSLRLSLMLLLR
jgi:hypothetical protein